MLPCPPKLHPNQLHLDYLCIRFCLSKFFCPSSAQFSSPAQGLQCFCHDSFNPGVCANTNNTCEVDGVCATVYTLTDGGVYVEYMCFSYDLKRSFDICSNLQHNVVVFCCFDEAECNRNFTTNPFATEATEPAGELFTLFLKLLRLLHARTHAHTHSHTHTHSHSHTHMHTQVQLPPF